MTKEQMVDVDGEALTREIAHHDLVLVDFWAAWCAPCRVISTLLERLALEFPNLRILKVDAEAHKSLLTDYDIRSLPSLLLYRSGKRVERLVGKVPYVLLQRAVQKAA